MTTASLDLSHRTSAGARDDVERAQAAAGRVPALKAHAVLVLDAGHRIIAANARAVRMLTQPNCLRVDEGTVSDFAGTASTAFETATTLAFEDHPLNVGVAIDRGIARGAWIVHVRHLPGHRYGQDAVALRLGPPPTGRMAVQFMGRLFSLAPVEVEVLEDLIGGRDVDAIARRLATTPSKVCSAVDSLICKTASRDEADVVAVALCAASLAAIEAEEAFSAPSIDDDLRVFA